MTALSLLILAALGLVAMLFQLGLLQRNREDALLGAVGVAPRQLLRWRLGEAGRDSVMRLAARWRAPQRDGDYRYAASSSPCFLISAESSQTISLVRASVRRKL